jgi:2,4-dienoyl-CoA reductase-like NADH-dependent reductase (Old Yellow Enzyme family)
MIRQHNPSPAKQTRPPYLTNGTVEVEVEDHHGQKTRADLAFVARQFLREPEFVLRTAHQLGVEVTWPNQYKRAGWPKNAKF